VLSCARRWRGPVSSYAFKTKPYRHQRRALRQLLRQEYGGALLMEPRTGKTKTTVDWLSVLHQQGKIERAVVVAPNRVMGVWLRELYAHSPRPLHVTVWDAKRRRQGGPTEPPAGVLGVTVVNYEAFAVPGRQTPSGRRSKASGRFLARRLLIRWAGPRAAMVLDESHKIKSPSGKAANMIVSMGDKFPYRAILTGTPLTKANRAHDIYMQWQFLNPERFRDHPTAEDFKNHYGRWTSKNGYSQYLGPKNLPELHRRIREDGFIVRRDECFDLPPREDLVEYVDLSRATARVYREMAEDMIAQLDDGSAAEASLKIVQALRLAQITSGFVTDETGVVRRLGFEKFEVLTSILEERWDQDQKMVVVARWKPDLDLIEDFGRTSSVPTYSVRGKVKRADSDRAIHEFQQSEGPSLMVLQPAAASLGIDLSTASHMVWYSHTPSWVDFTQCCDRIALSRSSTTFTHLVARSSVDEVLLATLAGDGDVARAIMTHPGELINGHPLDLDDQSRLKGIGSFQYTKGRKS
jgi:hypothetical protein